MSLCVSPALLAQGTINFVNSSNTLVKLDSTSVGGSLQNATSATFGTRIQLYYQSGTLPQPAAINSSSGLGNWTPLGGLGTIASNGRFSVGVLTTGPDVSATGTVWLQALAWDAAAATYTEAILNNLSGYFGASSVWNQPTGDPANPPAVRTDTPGYFSGVTMTPVPEPAATALAGLGVVCLILSRRFRG